MAVGPSNKGSGKLKRTTIDPRIGGTKGDAGPAGKAGAKGPGVLGGSRGRTKIDPRIGGQKGDAGFSGKAKQLSGFGKAFSVALAKGPGTLFTYQGKKYKAIKKHEGKGPSASRVQDKVTKATMVKGKRDTTKTKNSSLTAAVKKVKAKAPTPASGKFGQRKAGGMMKARVGVLAKVLSKKPKQDLGNYTKREVAELTKMDPKKQTEFMKLLDDAKATKMAKAKNKSTKKKIAAVGTIGVGAMLLDKKKKTTKKPKRKEDKVSQADIIGKGSKTGRRAGGMMKAKNGGFPDLSGDGKITKKDILMGRGVIKKRGGGAAIKGMNFKGVL